VTPAVRVIEEQPWLEQVCTLVISLTAPPEVLYCELHPQLSLLAKARRDVVTRPNVLKPGVYEDVLTSRVRGVVWR
jgi:hypothetical protein